MRIRVGDSIMHIPDSVYTYVQDIVDTIVSELQMIWDKSEMCIQYSYDEIGDIIEHVYMLGAEVSKLYDKGLINQYDVSDTIYSIKQVITDILSHVDGVLDMCHETRW